jgi:hypothetical protein
MTNSLSVAYLNSVNKYENWKRADLVQVIIVFAFILGIMGLGLAAYCAYKGMSFEYAVGLGRGAIKLGCKK